MYSMPPNRPLEVNLVTPSMELKSKKSRNISDVEKESIQTELAGFEDSVYQRVFHVSERPFISLKDTSTFTVLEVIFLAK